MASESTTTTVPSVPSTLPEKPKGKQPSKDSSTYYQERFDDAFAYLKQQPLAARLELLEMLRKKGFDSSTPVSATGMDASDVARLRELLVYQDTLSDVVTDDLLPGTIASVRKKFPDRAKSSVGSTRTPEADVDAYLTSVMQAKLGRSPRASEMEKFRKAYAAMETGGNEPTATVAAQQQIQAANPDEYEASQFASFASTFEQMLRSA